MSLQHPAQSFDTPRETTPIRLYCEGRRLEFITTRELASLLGFRWLRSVYRWIERHGLATYQESPKARVKVSAADVERVLGSHGKQSAEPLNTNQLEGVKREE